MTDLIFELGVLGLAFLMTIAVIRLALSIAEYLDRHNGKGS